MTGLLGTGTLGKLGYAIAWGSQGTTGNFPGGFIQQTALLQTSVVNPGMAPSTVAKASPPPPDLTTANAFNEVNYYPVSGGYVQRNFVGKLVYDFSPKTTLQFTTYSAQDWSNSTGEGDNDYETFPYVLYGAQQTLASIEATKKGLNTILVNGKPQSCHDSIAVLIDNPQGYTCMTPAQYAVNFYGPFGGSIDRWRTLGDVDYDARATQQLGSGLITLEGFDDNYNYNEQKGPGAAIGPYGPGPNYLDLYGNRGYLLSDDFAMSKNDFGFGYTLAAPGQYQRIVPVHAGERNDVQHLRKQPAALSRDGELLRPRYVDAQRQVFRLRQLLAPAVAGYLVDALRSARLVGLSAR